MKTRSILFSLMFLFSTAALLNCSGKKDDTAASHDEHTGHDTDHATQTADPANASAPQFQVDAKFQDQLATFFIAYLELKNAFVESDAAKVKGEATEGKQSLSTVDMTLLSGVAHNDWMAYLAPMETSLKEMEGSTDIAAQRKAFSTLSDNLYKSIKAFGLGGTEAFYDFCPMAFNNEGGYWLSDSKVIRNPYFGDEMLTCGSVKEVLQ